MQAQCPDCLEWFPVEWQDELPPGGYWWLDSAGCPGCSELVCVESECNFREGVDPSKCHKNGPDHDPIVCIDCHHLVELGVWTINRQGDKFVYIETGDCKNLYCRTYTTEPLECVGVFHITHADAIRSFAGHGARFCDSPLDAAGSEER